VIPIQYPTIPKPHAPWLEDPPAPSSTVTMERRRSAPTCIKAERMFMDVEPMILELGDLV